MRDSFSTYHPAVNLLFFTEVLGFSMFLLHPVCLAVSLAGAAAYDLYLNGKKALAFCLKGILPMMAVTALLNPCFNHQGATILAYLPSGNPLTLESILYGLAAAAMLAAVVLWFACFNTVITSDKFVYLFGRVIPSLSLVLSMALRFVPRFKAQLRTVTRAQKCIGKDPARGGLLHRIRCAGAILSTMVSWALENGIDTADSMKSRGYGLPGRTAFSIYRFQERDKIALLWMLFCGCYIGCGAFLGGLKWRYFPTIQGVALTPWTVSLHLVYLALCYTPVALDRREDWKWKYLKYEI